MIFIDSSSNINKHNLNFFYYTLCSALPLGKHFTESRISKTVIINTVVTVLECSRSLHACSVPRSRAAVPGKTRTKRLKLLRHLYVKK